MPIDLDTTTDDASLIQAAEIVASYVKHNNLSAADLPKLVVAVHAQLAALNHAGAAPAAEPVSAVQKPSPAAIRKSITPDALISFIDGKAYKAIKRHLTQHGLDAHAYRQRYGLPADYPTTAPNYSAARSEMAKKFGLGRPGGRAAKGEA